MGTETKTDQPCGSFAPDVMYGHEGIAVVVDPKECRRCLWPKSSHVMSRKARPTEPEPFATVEEIADARERVDDTYCRACGMQSDDTHLPRALEGNARYLRLRERIETRIEYFEIARSIHSTEANQREPRRIRDELLALLTDDEPTPSEEP